MNIRIQNVVVSPNMHIQSIAESFYYCEKPGQAFAAVMLQQALKTIRALAAENKQESVFIHRDDEAQCFAGCDVDEVAQADLLAEELKETKSQLSIVIDLEDNTNIITTLRKVEE